MSKKVKTSELFDCRTEYLKPLFASCLYPWQMLPAIKEYASKLIDQGIEGYTLLSPGVLVGENVKIHPTATIESPAIIGSGTELRPGAFVRGNVITGENCVIGNSTEVKNSILLNGVQVPHYNYVGDSILGNKAHMGAGAVTSNVKADKSLVVCAGQATGRKKVGALLGDHAEIGCNCVLNPGTVIGRNSNVYPLSCVRGTVPENHIYKDKDNVVRKK